MGITPRGARRVGGSILNLSVILIAGLLVVPSAGYLTFDALAVEGDTFALGHARPRESPPPAAAPREPEHHRGVQSIDLAVGGPFPTCPLECTMGYHFGEDGLAFDVPEGATRVVVRATWEAAAPTAHRLHVGLYTPDADCGEGCWRGQASEEGRSGLAFELVDPAPGPYRVSASGVGPAYAVAKQDVRLDAVVHFS